MFMATGEHMGRSEGALPDKSQWILYLLSSSCEELIVGAITDHSARDEIISIQKLQ